MIIAVCRDDKTILSRAKEQSREAHDIYGKAYLAGESIPKLRPNEDLFFTGHGASRGKSGNPEIGDHAKKSKFTLDGLELWDSFKELFPDGYHGDVYLDACYTADFKKGMLSLLEQFRSQAALALKHTRVFGRSGSIDYPIPPPGDPSWIQAR